MVYLCVCFGSMFTVLVQRYSKLHSAEALIVVNWPMGVLGVDRAAECGEDAWECHAVI